MTVPAISLHHGDAMRGFTGAILLTLVIFGGAVGYIEFEAYQLKRYCGRIPLGLTVAEVRDAAQEHGYSTSIEPYVQMKISPKVKDPMGRACRVFFNKEKTVEYRVFQGR